MIDDLSEVDQRRALVHLIDQLPSVSSIKEQLDSGRPLKSIDAPAGSIGVLRWVVGSCRAYLKEAKAGEGVLNDVKTSADQHHYGGEVPSAQVCRQFAFVVGSPEQEERFKDEVEKAKVTHKNVEEYPTLLAFHGEFQVSLRG